MRVTATRTVYVTTESGEKLLNKGESADVDGRTYSNKHPFILAGYLVAEQAPEKPKRQPKAEQAQDDPQPKE